MKQTTRGVDLLSLLCHTSKDLLKEMIGKSHKAMEDFSKNPMKTLECKTETLDKIDTCMSLNNFCPVCVHAY